LLGIIFTGGQGPLAQDIKRLIGGETKDAIFVAADSGLAAVIKAGFKPDWVIGDMDSLEDASLLDAVPQENIIKMKHDKDYTDTELAFSLAVEKGCDNIWIIGGGGGRIDHLFGIRSLFERAIFPNRWTTDSADIQCIDSEVHQSEISFSVKHDTPVTVFPLGAGPWDAESNGLKWPLKGLHWDRGFFSLSNTAVDGAFSVKARQGRFMVILPVFN